MGENTKIEWADHTFNPWLGCTKVSPGCEHCYAERLALRYKWVKWGKGQPRKLTGKANWRKPITWNKRAQKLGIRYRVFCASLADWLDPEVDPEWRYKLMDLIEQTPFLDWLLLTKRPERFYLINGDIPANVWLGVTAENQIQWDRRVGILMGMTCEVRFVSVEPMLDPINANGLYPEWVIVGGESGSSPRPMHSGWGHDLRMSLGSDVYYFFKQRGGNFHGTPVSSMREQEIPHYDA